MILDQVLSAAADPSGVTPLDALGLFVGIPVLIIVVIVGAVYGSRWRAVRSEGRPPQRSAEPPPLTEPVLGRPDQPSRRLDRAREEADSRRAGVAQAPADDVAEVPPGRADPESQPG